MNPVVTKLFHLLCFHLQQSSWPPYDHLHTVGPFSVLSKLYHCFTRLSPTSINSDFKFNLQSAIFRKSKISPVGMKVKVMHSKPATQGCFFWRQSQFYPGKGVIDVKSLAWPSNHLHETAKDWFSFALTCSTRVQLSWKSKHTARHYCVHTVC